MDVLLLLPVAGACATGASDVLMGGATLVMLRGTVIAPVVGNAIAAVEELAAALRTK